MFAQSVHQNAHPVVGQEVEVHDTLQSLHRPAELELGLLSSLGSQPQPESEVRVPVFLGRLELEFLDSLRFAVSVGLDEVVQRGRLVRFGVVKLGLTAVVSFVGKDEIVPIALVVNELYARHYHKGKLHLRVLAQVVVVPI